MGLLKDLTTIGPAHKIWACQGIFGLFMVFSNIVPDQDLSLILGLLKVFTNIGPAQVFFTNIWPAQGCH